MWRKSYKISKTFQESWGVVMEIRWGPIDYVLTLLLTYLTSSLFFNSSHTWLLTFSQTCHVSVSSGSWHLLLHFTPVLYMHSLISRVPCFLTSSDLAVNAKFSVRSSLYISFKVTSHSIFLITFFHFVLLCFQSIYSNFMIHSGFYSFIEFIKRNINSMRTGFLPILFTIE